MILGWNDDSPRLARRLGAGLLAIATLLVPRPAAALDEDPKPEEKSDGSLYLVPLLAPKAPAIDGRLNEEGWGNAAGIVRLHKLGAPKENPSRATEVYLTIDADNLYVAFRCGEPFPERRKRSAKGRDLDGIAADDTVSVQLQPGEDAKAPYYEVTVTSTGAVALTQHGTKSKAWNAGGIQAAVRDALGGWVVEVRVPFKAMGRSTPEAGERWRANFVRHIATVEPPELATWAPQATVEARQAEHFAELRFE
jgi:hypothetical protein